MTTTKKLAARVHSLQREEKCILINQLLISGKTVFLCNQCNHLFLKRRLLYSLLILLTFMNALTILRETSNGAIIPNKIGSALLRNVKIASHIVALLQT